MKIYLILIFTTLIFFSGCSKLLINSQTDLPTDTQNLAPVEKRFIYQTIQNEINIYYKNGNEYYKDGYNYDAIIAYERVNFYKGYNYIPIKKINKIKLIAKKNSIHHYKELKKCKKKYKKERLHQLNKIVMNDPNYKDSSKHLKKLKEDREIKIFLNSLQNSLNMAILSNKNTTNTLKSINQKSTKLIKYDYRNPLIHKAKHILKKEYKVLMKDAVKTYNKGNINSAKKKFKAILSIYQTSTKSDRYLLKIKRKQDIQLNLNRAQKALNKKEYFKALKLTRQVLKIDFNNKKAKSIKHEVQDECNKQISKLIYQGIINYDKKNLNKAQKNFQEVLKIDPNNNTALIYTKKIEMQLKTIKSLE